MTRGGRAALRGVALALTLSAAAGRARGDEITIVSPHWEGIRREFGAAFGRHYAAAVGRPVEVRWLDVGGGASDVLRYVTSRFAASPEGIGVDVLFGGGTEPFVRLAGAGRLAPVDLPPEVRGGLATEAAGEPLHDPHGRWYSAWVGGVGILWNRASVGRLGLPEPRAWDDLSDARYAGRIGNADPRKSGSAHLAYEVILQAYGWAAGWRVLTGIGANTRAFASSASQVPWDVVTGEAAAGFAIDSYAREALALAGPQRVGFVLPRGMSPMSGDGIAVLRGAPSPEAARAFVAFCLSDAGQKLLLLRPGDPEGPAAFALGRTSVRPLLYRDPRVRAVAGPDPYDDPRPTRYDPAVSAARYDAVNDLVGAFVIDPHDRVAAAGPGRTPVPPVDEAEIDRSVLRGDFADRKARSRMTTEWEKRMEALYPYPPAPPIRIVWWCVAAVVFARAVGSLRPVGRRGRPG